MKYYRATYIGRTESYRAWGKSYATELVYNCTYYISVQESPYPGWRYLIGIYSYNGSLLTVIPYKNNWREYWNTIGEIERYMGKWRMKKS